MLYLLVEHACFETCWLDACMALAVGVALFSLPPAVSVVMLAALLEGLSWVLSIWGLLAPEQI